MNATQQWDTMREIAADLYAYSLMGPSYQEAAEDLIALDTERPDWWTPRWEARLLAELRTYIDRDLEEAQRDSR